MWRFCEGWHPERIAMAAEFYEFEDLDLLLSQLMALHDLVSAHKAAKQGAR